MSFMLSLYKCIILKALFLQILISVLYKLKYSCYYFLCKILIFKATYDFAKIYPEKKGIGTNDFAVKLADD